MRWAALAVGVAVASPAWARGGLYFGIGLGGTVVNGEEIPASRVDFNGVELTDANGNVISGGIDQLRFSTDNGTGGAGLLRLGFNVLGYAALETVASGNVNKLGRGDAEWGTHWSMGVRLYPVWHWQNYLPEILQPMEPSLYFGGGFSYAGYAPEQMINTQTAQTSKLGWRDAATFRFGMGVEYFISQFSKLTLDYNYTLARHEVMIIDFATDARRKVEPAIKAEYHEFIFGITAHIPVGPQSRDPAPTVVEPASHLEAGSAEVFDTDAPPPAEEVESPSQSEPAPPAADDGDDEEIIDI